MKKTRQKIIETIGHIDRAMKHEGVIFGIAMVDNKEACARVKRQMETVVKPSEAYEKYDAERLALCTELAPKDDKGQPVRKIADAPPGTPQGMMYFEYVGLTDNPKWEPRFKALCEQHKDALEARKKQIEDVEKALLEEVEIELQTVKLSDVPPKLSGAEIEPLRFLIVNDLNGKK